MVMVIYTSKDTDETLEHLAESVKNLAEHDRPVWEIDGVIDKAGRIMKQCYLRSSMRQVCTRLANEDSYTVLVQHSKNELRHIFDVEIDDLIRGVTV